MQPNEYQLPAIGSGMTKAQISASSKNLVDTILETGNVIEVAEAISGMEQFLKEVKGDERFVAYLREEVAKFGKVTTRPSGAKIELAETGTKYDYSKTDDFILPDLQKQSDELAEKIKARQGFLKAIPVEGMELLNESSGEMVRVYPPSKTSTSSYKVTLAK